MAFLLIHFYNDLGFFLGRTEGRVQGQVLQHHEDHGLRRMRQMQALGKASGDIMSQCLLTIVYYVL